MWFELSKIAISLRIRLWQGYICSGMRWERTSLIIVDLDKFSNQFAPTCYAYQHYQSEQQLLAVSIRNSIVIHPRRLDVHCRNRSPSCSHDCQTSAHSRRMLRVSVSSVLSWRHKQRISKNLASRKETLSGLCRHLPCRLVYSAYVSLGILAGRAPL